MSPSIVVEEEEDDATTIEQFLNYQSILVSDSETLAISVFDNRDEAAVEGEVQELKASILAAAVEGGLQLIPASTNSFIDDEDGDDEERATTIVRKEKPTFWGELLK